METKRTSCDDDDGKIDVQKKKKNDTTGISVFKKIIYIKKDTGPLNGFNSNQFKCPFHTINSPLIKIDDGAKKKTLNICKETRARVSSYVS